MTTSRRTNVTELKLLLEQLTEAYHFAENQKYLLKKVCRDYRNLFKPWPRRQKREVDGHGDSTRDQTGSDTKENTLVTSSGVNNAELVKLTNAEHAEITLVEQALTKAERTRQKFHGKQQTENENQGKKPNGLPMWEKAKQTPLENDKMPPKPTSKSKTGAVQQGNNPTHGTISQRRLDSLTGRQTASRTSSKYVPAHASAPFKTEPRSAPVRRPPSARSVHGRVSVLPPSDKIVGHQQRNLKPYQVSKPQHRQPHEAGRDIAVQEYDNKLRNDNVTGHVQHLDKALSSQHLNDDPAPIIAQGEIRSTAGQQNLGDSMQRLEIKDQQGQDENIEKSSIAEETRQISPPPFNLYTDGCKLTLPSKLSRLYSHNRRLRGRVAEAAVTVKVQPTASNPALFMQKLQEHIDAHINETNESVMFRDIVCACQVNQGLLQMLADVGYLNESEDVRWDDVLRAKTKLEHIFETFTQMESKCQDLLQGYKGGLSGQTAVKSIISQHAAESIAPWSSQILVTGGPTLLSYHNKHQLLKYTRLVQEVVLLQLQRAVIDASSCLLSTWEAQPIDRCASMQLFHSVYSLLCTCGRLFPSIVEDSIEELQDDVNDF